MRKAQKKFQGQILNLCPQKKKVKLKKNHQFPTLIPQQKTKIQKESQKKKKAEDLLTQMTAIQVSLKQRNRTNKTSEKPSKNKRKKKRRNHNLIPRILYLISQLKKIKKTLLRKNLMLSLYQRKKKQIRVRKERRNLVRKSKTRSKKTKLSRKTKIKLPVFSKTHPRRSSNSKASLLRNQKVKKKFLLRKK